MGRMTLSRARKDHRIMMEVLWSLIEYGSSGGRGPGVYVSVESVDWVEGP